MATRRSTLLLLTCLALVVDDAPAEATPPVATERVSVDAAADSLSPSIDERGRRVAYESGVDVFVRDRRKRLTTLVSADTPGGAIPSVSANGRYIAYFATPLDDAEQQVFVRDVVAGTTTLASAAADGSPGNGSSGPASISADGRHVAFVSWASNLVPGDGNDQPDVFVRDLDTGHTARANVDTAGGDSAFADFGGGLFPDSPGVLSADGRYVTFLSPASDLVAGDDDLGQNDVFVRDVVDGVTTLVSDAPEVAVVLNPAISANGRRVAYTNAQFGFIRGGDVLVRDLAGRGTVKANVDTGDPESFSFSTPSLSDGGRYVAFESSPVNDVGPANEPMASNVFVRDLVARKTRRVSVGIGGAAPNGSSFDPALSLDGRWVAYVSAASNLVSGDGNGLRDVFVGRR
jgi:Tol biopolymer transport system component